MTIPKVIAAGGLAILVFDTAWATVARLGGYDYTSLFWVSFLLYAMAGFVAGRVRGTGVGALAGLAVALVDGTLGWWVSAVIGPGAVSGATPIAVAGTVATVAVTGFFCGLIGSLVARFFPSRR